MGGQLATCLVLTIFYVLIAIPLAWFIHDFWLRRHGFKLSRRRPALTVISNAAALCLMGSRVWQLWMVFFKGFEVTADKGGPKGTPEKLFVYFLYTFFLYFSAGMFLFPLSVRLWLTYFEVNLAVANNDKQWITLITAELNWKSPLRVIRDPTMTQNRLTLAAAHNNPHDGRTAVNSVSFEVESPVSGQITSFSDNTETISPPSDQPNFTNRHSSKGGGNLVSIDRDKTTVSTAALKRVSVAQGGSTSRKYRRQSIAARAISNDYSVHNYNKRSTNILISPSGRKLISSSAQLNMDDDDDSDELADDDFGDYPMPDKKKTIDEERPQIKARKSTDPSEAVTKAIAETTAAATHARNTSSMWVRGSVTAQGSETNVMNPHELRSANSVRNIFERQSWFFTKMHTFGNERWVLTHFGQVVAAIFSLTLTVFLVRKFEADEDAVFKALATLYYVITGLLIAGFFFYIAINYPHYYRDSLNVYDELKLLTVIFLSAGIFAICWLVWASAIGFRKSPFEVEAVLNFAVIIGLGLTVLLETYWVLNKVGDSGRASDRFSSNEKFTLSNMSRALNEEQQKTNCCTQISNRLDQFVFGTNDIDMIQMAREELDKTDAGPGALVESAVLGGNKNTLKLVDILASENGFREFMTYLFSEFAYENLVCLLELLQFRQLIVESQIGSVTAVSDDRSFKDRNHTRGAGTMAVIENAFARFGARHHGLFGRQNDSIVVRDPVPPTPQNENPEKREHIPNVTEFAGMNGVPNLLDVGSETDNEDGTQELISPISTSVATAADAAATAIAAVSVVTGRKSMTAPLARPSVHDMSKEHKPRNNTRASLTVASQSDAPMFNSPTSPLALHAKVRVVLPISVMNIKSSIVWDRYLTIEEKYLVICEKYLFSHSELPINLSFRTRKKITKLADQLKDWYGKNPLYENINGEIVGETAPDPDDLENKPVVNEQVFDVVIKELKGLLRDTLSRFHNTDAFKKLQNEFDMAQAN